MKMNMSMAMGGLAVPQSEPSDKEYYPSFHYSGKKELDIPREGTMVIRFKRTNKTESENADGEENYSCCIEVREVVSVKEDPCCEEPASNRDEGARALSKLRAEKMKKESEDESY